MVVQAAVKFQNAFNLSLEEPVAQSYQQSRKDLKNAYIVLGKDTFLERVSSSSLEVSTQVKLAKKVEEWGRKGESEQSGYDVSPSVFTHFETCFNASEQNEVMQTMRKAKKELKQAVKNFTGERKDLEKELQDAGVEGKSLKKVAYLFTKLEKK